MTSRRLSSSRPTDPSSRRQHDGDPRDAATNEADVKGSSSHKVRPWSKLTASRLTRGRSTREEKPRRTPAVQRPHVPVAMGWGAVSALITMLLLAVPVFLGWALDVKSSSSWNQTLGVAIDLWALAHRAHVHSSETTIVFSPLVLTALCVLGARFGAKRALPAQRLSFRDLGMILAGFVVGYVLAAQFLGIISSLGSNTINPFTLFIGPAVVAAAGVAWATWRERRNSPELAAFDEAVVDATPLLAQRSIRAAVRGLGLLAALMLVVLCVLIAWHGHRVWAVQSQLHPGAAGGILLLLGQIAALPNMLALLAGWAVGAPVHVGSVVVGHSGMSAGTLPMIPVFGAIPQGGMHTWSWVLLALPLIVGGFIGWDAAGSLTRLSSLRAKALVGLCAAAMATVALWLIWWFSAASISTGLLSYVGPGWTAWLYAPVVFVVPAVLLAAVRHWVMNHRHP